MSWWRTKYWSYSPHQLRDMVFPVCRNFKKLVRTFCWFKKIVRAVSQDFLKFSWQLSEDFVRTYWELCDFWDFFRLSETFLRTFFWFSKNFLWLSEDFVMIFWGQCRMQLYPLHFLPMQCNAMQCAPTLIFSSGHAALSPALSRTKRSILHGAMPTREFEERRILVIFIPSFYIEVAYWNQWDR